MHERVEVELRRTDRVPNRRCHQEETIGAGECDDVLHEGQCAPADAERRAPRNSLSS